MKTFAPPHPLPLPPGERELGVQILYSKQLVGRPTVAALIGSPQWGSPTK
jgi:hypothetical protein